jgi:hypothetical protein
MISRCNSRIGVQLIARSCRVRADFPPPGGSKIARADVAHFIGTALTSASYIRECPALAY